MPRIDSLKPFGRVPPRVIEQVAGDLLDHEPVVGQVGVECTDHVVAIAEGVGDVVVELVPGGLGVADQVEPVPGPALAVAGLASSRSTSRS